MGFFLVNCNNIKVCFSCVFFRSHDGSKLEGALGRLGAVVLGQMGVVCCRRAPPKRMGDGVSRLGRVVVVCRRRPQTLLDLALGRGSLGRGAPPRRIRRGGSLLLGRSRRAALGGSSRYKRHRHRRLRKRRRRGRWKRRRQPVEEPPSSRCSRLGPASRRQTGRPLLLLIPLEQWMVNRETF